MLRTKLRTWGLVVIGGFLLAPGWCQKIADFDREYAKAMLKQISSDVRKHYYDPKLHGLEWDSSVREMEQLIDRAETTDDALSQVAALLDSLKDSHTFFLPPQRPYHLDYGWRAEMIGDHCYIVRVRPGSDADAKGVKRGDEVLAINGYTPVRNNFSKLEYVFNTLRPQRSLRLFLRDPAGKKSTVEALANVTSMNAAKQMTWDLGGNQRHDAVLEREERVHEARPRIAEMGDQLMILKLSAFFFSQAETDSLMGKARKHKFLIIDVRGNPGGSIDALKYLIGGLFERDVTIGDRVSRGERKPIIARTHGQFFEGKVLVLVDNMSASASELLARVVQLEKRGIVLGDTTAGKVMESKLYTYKTGVGTVVLYGASITDADIIMTDGSSLERAGVTPDERVLPTAADLAEGHDPVLAHAAEAASVKLSPDSAEKLFPYEWPRRSMGDD